MNGPFIPPAKRSFTPWLLMAAAGLALAAYLIVSARVYRLGFPLDDAWIHQTYARNLGLHLDWAYLPGQPSAGSTSPLWTLLLAVGYPLGWMPYAWTYLLGGLGLAGLALAGEAAIRRILPRNAGRLPWMGLLLVGEWHLVWAAASGMETILYAALIMIVLALLVREHPNAWLCGALVGLAAWVRPDGITLMGPVLFVFMFNEKSWRSRLLACAKACLGMAFLFAPYLVFNRLLAGAWWPNTFYAKQAEYASQLQIPLLQRLVSLFSLPLVGVGALLLPGTLLAVWLGLKKRRWVVLAAFLWWAGYTLIYALRLPVTYQHGRYLIPAMPVFFLLGGMGLSEFRSLVKGRLPRLIGRIWAAAGAAVLLAFLMLGANSYAQDVKLIETEMVDTAHWVAKNTPPDALVAAHDIGAVGYFGDRKLLDLAGLISPEVIPFMRDETRLAAFLDQQQIDYLVTFPDWYERLADGRDIVYSTRGSAVEAGGQNMCVYGWKR